MKIKKIELKNFKFHSNLEFEIKEQNCLIYGENGTGKSSIYEALYSVFKVFYRNQDFNFTKFKNNNSEEQQEVKITLGKKNNNHDVELKIPNENYNLPSEIALENRTTIYFASQDLLNIIINSDKDFYEIVDKDLSKYFDNLKNIHIEYKNINDLLNVENRVQKTEDKFKLDNKYKNLLIQIQLRTNDIINNHFKENFNINFKFYSGELNNDVQFDNPSITLEINNENNLKLNFNEAKLKLTSIAIFFALIKIEEDKNNPLKLLVLDDFLTSLDMANRHYIVEYIFKEFKKYQKIILTHNLQFNNLIIDYLKNKNQDKDWAIKNIYLKKDNDAGEKAIIYDKNSDYIREAQNKLNSNHLEIAGNLLRKEFERLLHELEKIYQIGKREESSVILSLILNNKPNFNLHIKILKEVESKINNFKNLMNNYTTNEYKIKDSVIELDNYIKESKETQYPQELREIIKNLTFYKTILMNKASHNNPEAETYQKEYENAVKIIKDLKSYIDDLLK